MLLELFFLLILLISYQVSAQFDLVKRVRSPETTTFSPLENIKFPDAQGVLLQKSSYDCGDAALTMILNDFDIPITYEELHAELHTPTTGASMLSLRNMARRKGLLSEGWDVGIHDLHRIPLPALGLVNRGHFVVIAGFSDEDHVEILDPARGKLQMPIHKFASIWSGETLLFHKPGGAPGHWFKASPQPR